ncbi:MAG: hypothetical protein WC551_07620 [Patescibacteria group bacterium]
MPGYSRATMPSEFYDITKDMLLRQPEPQYVFWLMFRDAMRVQLTPPSSIGLQLPGRTVAGVGADYVTPERDRLMLSDPLTTELIAAKVDFAALPGQTVRINRPLFTNTIYTEASRRIATGSSISTTPITISGQQTDLTLFRYAGPYDTVNSCVAPYAIEAFDANMGVHNAARIVGTHLARDFHRFVDAVHVALLDLSATTVYPAGMTADNDATTAGAFPFTYALVSDVEQQMDTANLPRFSDGHRIMVCTPVQKQQLRNDVQYQRASQYFREMNILFGQTYFGSVNNFHLFVNNTNTITPNGSSVNIHHGYAMCPGVFLGGMGRPPVVIPASDDNYGETVKVIWKGDLSFGLSDDRFVYGVHSSA